VRSEARGGKVRQCSTAVAQSYFEVSEFQQLPHGAITPHYYYWSDYKFGISLGLNGYSASTVFCWKMNILLLSLYDNDFLTACVICQLTCPQYWTMKRIEVVKPNFKLLSKHFPEGAEKEPWRNRSQKDEHPGLDLKSWSPEYETGKLLSQSWSVLEKWLRKGGFWSCILIFSLFHKLFACHVPATSSWGISLKPLQIWFDFSCKQLLLDLI
jgi:hypothetical protein